MILNSNLQTGITVNDKISHHRRGGGQVEAMRIIHTVDGDCNGLGQLVAISSHE